MNRLRVLAYHRVADFNDDPDLHPGLISATPASFARQMEYLAAHYYVVSIEDVLDAVQAGKKLPTKSVLITFDDAYLDFKDVAWPILRRHRFPVTVFVPTAFPADSDRRFWWDQLYRSIVYALEDDLHLLPLGALGMAAVEDRIHILKKFQNYIKSVPHDEAMGLVDEIGLKLKAPHDGQRSIMNWEELRQLTREGVTLGAHTRTHPILTQISPEKVRQEGRGSIADLKREMGSVLPIFCYPNGCYNQQIVDILKEEGVLLGFSIEDGHNDLNRPHLLRLRRTAVTLRTSFFIFQLRLLRCFSYIDMWRHRHKN